jgi:isoleucyl-tRNA synthetase
MLARTRELTEKVRDWYAAFEFHRIYHAVNEFAIVDLSSFYLDVLKDRMYTFAPTSQARRSAQTVLWQITEALVRLVAPILSFTADEVWEHLPAVEGREASVHLAQFPKPEEIYTKATTPLIEKWGDLFEIRDEALRFLEETRQAKKIGKGLEAELEISAWGHYADVLNTPHGADFKEFFNVSAVRFIDVSESRNFQEPLDLESPSQLRDYDRSGDFRVKILPARGHKCARCWNFMPEVSNYGIWENVCNRCQSALAEMKIAPPTEDAQ